MRFLPAQRHYLENRTNDNIILKARQLGFTTLAVIEMLDDAITRPNSMHAILAHRREDVQKIFRIAKTAFEYLPKELKPKAKYDNKNELYFFEQNSGIYVDLKIRGGTINTLHVTEGAHIKNFEAILAASAESVPKHGRTTIESTANGLGGYFYQLYKGAETGANEYSAHFYNWAWDREYKLPVDGRTFSKADRQYQERHNLTDEQLAWRQWKRGKIGDRLFPQEYPMTAQEAFIASGGCRFNVDIIKEMMDTVDQPVKTDEHLTIWKEPDGGKQYVMGSDCSKGLQTGDWQVTTVLEKESGEQVAELRCRVPIERFTKMSMKLGRLYNNALWGIELQDHGFTAINIAKKDYPNLYQRTKLTHSSGHDKKVKELGWSTNRKTKPVMIDDLDTAIIKRHTRPHSMVFLSECTTYMEDPDGMTDAAEGAHDDTVIAYAIAWQMRKHVRPLAKVVMR